MRCFGDDFLPNESRRKKSVGFFIDFLDGVAVLELTSFLSVVCIHATIWRWDLQTSTFFLRIRFSLLRSSLYSPFDLCNWRRRPGMNLIWSWYMVIGKTVKSLWTGYGRELDKVSGLGRCPVYRGRKQIKRLYILPNEDFDVCFKMVSGW